jgi:hypothetical protein
VLRPDWICVESVLEAENGPRKPPWRRRRQMAKSKSLAHSMSEMSKFNYDTSKYVSLSSSSSSGNAASKSGSSGTRENVRDKAKK